MRNDIVTRDFVGRVVSRLSHDRAQFAVQNFEHGFDASLAKSPESPALRSPNTYRSCAKRQGFENVRAAPHAAVHNHGHSATNRVENIRQALNSRAQRVFGTSTVIRNDQSVHAVLDRELRVFARYDAL